MLDKDAFETDWEKTYHPNQMKKANNYHKPRQKAVISDIPAYEESRARTEHLKAELLKNGSIRQGIERQLYFVLQLVMQMRCLVSSWLKI